MSKTIFDIHAQTTSWEFIAQRHLDRLPVNPVNLCSSLGIQLMSYSYYSDVIGKPISYITQKYSSLGFCLFYEGQYYVVCNNTLLGRVNLNYTIIHELAHIVLGHIGPALPYLSLTHFTDDKPEEFQADKFAGRVLCPSIVLHLCGVSSPGEVELICDVSPDIAKLRWEHLQELRRLKRFLQVPEERAVMNQFAVFIANYVADKYNKDVTS